MLEHDPAIVTILGPGGIGKTRFVLELARLLAEDAEGGTLFVPLAPCSTRSSCSRPRRAVGTERPEPQAIAARIGEKCTHLVQGGELLSVASAVAVALGESQTVP